MQSDLAANNVPLVVDLDGTLIHTDLLLESALQLIKRHPLDLLRMPLWLVAGKAALKDQIAQRVALDVSALPYNAALVAYLREQKASGRKLVLATASHQSYANAVAAHLQLFDEVLATDAGRNLSSHTKRDVLVQRFGPQGFDYAGNSTDDMAVWQQCRQGLVVNPDRGVAGRTRNVQNLQAFPAAPVNPWREWLRAIRLHQWMKNLLIFVPLLASHQFGQPGQIARGLVAFVVFGLCASSVYLLNDMLDLADDRLHPTKRERPFAAGRLSLQSGILGCAVLLLGAFALGWWLLPPMFTLCLAAYFALTLAYSLILKQIAIVDVVVLAMLYTQRIFAGTFAFAVAPTFWLLAFSLFIFFSLALVKRYAELHEARNQLLQGPVRGRGYTPDDLGMIAALGAASGYISVMVMALYVQDRATSALYARPEVMWLVCPLLLFWISRTWLLTYRGQMHDDPVVFALKDKTSLAVAMLFAAVFWLAI